MGLLLRVYVSPANLSDREGAKILFGEIHRQFPRLAHIWADQGYAGSPLITWTKEQTGCTLEIVSREQPALWSKNGEKALPNKGFVILPRRWVVERTFAWGGRNRRLSKDYEGLTTTGEALISMGMVYLMLKRLTR